jgi:hypothetical protein
MFISAMVAELCLRAIDGIAASIMMTIVQHVGLAMTL